MRNSLFSLSCAMAMGITSGTAFAQAGNYPNKPVSVVIGFAAGGPTDVEATVYMNKLSEIFKVPFVKDFKPGAGGTRGAAVTAKAAPDGYTLQGISGFFVTTPFQYKDLTYDVRKDFSAISLMSRRFTVIVGSPNAPFNDLREFAAYAKKNPGKVNIGTAGLGGSPHINAAWLMKSRGTQATFVHYKGTGPQMIDLLAGRVELYVGTLVSTAKPIRDGKLMLLAGGAATLTTPLFPNMVPAAQQGAKDYDYNAFFGFNTAAGVPQPIIHRLSEALVRIAKMPDVAKVFESDGGVMVGSTPAEFEKEISTLLDRYGEIIGELDLPKL